MHKLKLEENEVMNMKKGQKGYIRGFRGRKWKEKSLIKLLSQKLKRITNKIFCRKVTIIGHMVYS